MVIQAWPKFFKSKDSTSETVDLVTPLNKRTVLSSRRNLRKFIFDIIGIMFVFKEFFLEIGVTTKESENTLTLGMTVKRTPSGTRLASTDSESWTATTFHLEAKLRPPLRMKKSPKNMITNTMMNPYPNPHLSTHLILPINNPNFWPETWPDILPASLQKWRPLPQPQGQDYPQPRLLWEFFHEDKFNWKDFPPDLTLLSNQTKLDNILSYLFLWTKSWSTSLLQFIEFIDFMQNMRQIIRWRRILNDFEASFFPPSFPATWNCLDDILKILEKSHIRIVLFKKYSVASIVIFCNNAN